MSTRDLVESLYQALADGDREALGALLHPDFSGRTAIGMPLGLGGTYDSPESMQRDFWWRLGRSFEARALPAEVDLLEGGGVVVRGRYVGRGRSSGLPLDAAFVHVLRILDGRIVALEQLTDTAAWHAALGAEAPLETIRYSVEDGVATVRLHRPEVRNAIDLRVAQETLTVARRLESDPGVRAVLICGSGPALTVGGDISYFERAGGDDLGALLRTMTTPFHEAFAVLSRLEAPIVTAVHGAVAGGGLGYVYAADITLAADDATFVTAFADLGVSGDGGGTWHLPRLVGRARAMEILLQNRPVSATEAVEIGLISRVVPAAELEDQARELVTRLAAGPTKGLAGIRRLVRDGAARGLEEHLRAETEAIVETGRTRDFRAAVDAFLAKRRPTFEGR